MENTDKNYISISQVEAETINRVSSGHDELDWLYGLSRSQNGDIWGIPVRTISTWVGEGGVGKSRLAINIAKKKVLEGKKVLYFQNEVDLSTLASWVGDSSGLHNFFCSGVTSLAEQIEVIRDISPDFVFVDSINLIDEFGSGTASSIKTIIDGFRSAINGSDTHIIVLCQLNKEGQATGSTALSHLPDINLTLTNTESDGVFSVSIGKKHRYGRKGSSYTSLWKHTETGVECISSNRKNDDRWKKDIVTPNRNLGNPPGTSNLGNPPGTSNLGNPPVRSGLGIPPVVSSSNRNSTYIPPYPVGNQNRDIVPSFPAKSNIEKKYRWDHPIVEAELVKMNFTQRDDFFRRNPGQSGEFYRKYPQLQYGVWGILGKSVHKWIEKFR